MRATWALIPLLACAGAVVAAEVPRPSPELVILMPNGKQQLLSEYRGKVVAVEFLYTTCPHCLHTSRFMEKLYKELGPKGFQPLGVAFNPMAGMLLPDFVKDAGATYPIGFSERDPVLNYLQHSPMLRFVVPQMVLIDRNGVIRAQSDPMGADGFFTSEDKIRERILSLVNEQPSTKRRPARKNSGS